MLRRFLYFIPILIGLVLAALIAAGLYAEEERYAHESRLGVFYKLSSIQGGLETGVNSRLHLAGALRSFVALEPDIDQPAFAKLVRRLFGTVTGIRHVELARNNIITHIYPEQKNGSALGRNLLVDFPVEIMALTQRAVASRQTQVSGPMQTLDGGKAIIAVTPVYLPFQPPSGPATYWGAIVMFIDTKTLLREAGIGFGSPDIDVAIREPGAMPGQGSVLYGDETVFSLNPVVMSTSIPGGYWQVGAVPVGGWSESPNHAFIVYFGGGSALLLTLLLMSVIVLLLNRIEEREKYRLLVQTAKSIILRIDMEGTITFCNEYAEEFFGYDPGELPGKSIIGTLITEGSLGGGSVKRYVTRLLKNPTTHPFNENINVRKNGEMVWVAWANKPVMARDGTMVELLCVGTNITDRKLMEEALKHNERQYRMLAENVTDIILGMDADMRITYVSPSDRVSRGFERHEVLGRPLGDFLSRRSEHVLEKTLATLTSQIGEGQTAPATTLDMEFTCADNSTLWLETRIVLLLNEEGELIGMQGVARDVTERKQAQNLRDDVERMARHDLKTPLSAVIGLPAEIRRAGDLTVTQGAMLETIENAGEAMLNLIDRSLDLFKMECGTYVLRRTRVDVLPILERIKNEIRTSLREKGISLGIEIVDSSNDGSFPVQVEEGLFRSMLSNLLVNAVQASPDGGSIAITLSRSDMATIVIRNTGEVPEYLRASFFDKYATGQGTGSGLGTHSARLVARTHGGDITVDICKPGETSLVVTLPL